MSNRKLTKPVAWAKQRFTNDSMPALNTLKNWIKNGTVDGEIVGGIYYIYEDSPVRSEPLSSNPAISGVTSSELDDFLAA